MSGSTQEIASRIKSVVAEVFPNHQGDLDRSLRVKEDLGADSMAVISLMIALDAEFDIEFDPSKVPVDSVTLGWIEDFVTSHLPQDT